MTGFARSQGKVANADWTWELRAVNGKGLDVRLRLPQGFEPHESAFRKQFATVLSRGNVQASLTIDEKSGAAVPTINQAALDAVLDGLNAVQAATDTAPSSAAQILSLRGVLEMSASPVNEEERAQLVEAICAGLDEALESLSSHRLEEGAALSALMNDHVDEIARLTALARLDPSASIASIHARMTAQISNLATDSNGVDSDRLHQEAAVLATKADIREEIDRLDAHVASARDMLAAGSPIGRKLEFLSQEFNREANTLCSKANGLSITNLGMELKATIDQFREQSLNVE